MQQNTPLYDFDLSIRTFNCLRRARVDTMEDLTQRLTEDFEGLMKFRNLGKKSRLEMLTVAAIHGYPVEKAISTYLSLLRERPDTPESERKDWEEIRQIFATFSRNRAMDHPGTPLSTLSGCKPEHIRQLGIRGIFTAEELLEAESARTVSDDLLRALDAQGYRFRDCTRAQWPSIEQYLMVRHAEETEYAEIYLSDLGELLLKDGVTLSQLVTKDWQFLQKYMTNGAIMDALVRLDAFGFRMNNCPTEQYPRIVPFVLEHIPVDIDNAGFPAEVSASLLAHGIGSLQALLKHSAAGLLEDSVVDEWGLDRILSALADYRLTLQDYALCYCSSCGRTIPYPAETYPPSFCIWCTLDD